MTDERHLTESLARELGRLLRRPGPTPPCLPFRALSRVLRAARARLRNRRAGETPPRKRAG